MIPERVDTRLVEEMWRSQKRFGHRAARLYPLMNRKVRTSQGVGTLWQVNAGKAGIVLENYPKRIVYVPVEDIKPAKSDAG